MPLPPIDSVRLWLGISADVMWWVAILSYSLLAVSLIADKRVYNWPLFTLYCILTVLRLLVWNPWDVPVLYLSSAIDLLMRGWILVEAFYYATEFTSRSERWNLFMGASIAGAIAAITSVGLYDLDRPIDWYRQAVFSSSVWLAMVCLMTCTHFALNPMRFHPETRRHGLLLTCYLCGRALTGMVVPREMRVWLLLNILVLAFRSACVWMWIRPRNQAPHIIKTTRKIGHLIRKRPLTIGPGPL